MAKKSDRVQVILECTEAKKEGETPSRYHTFKNKRSQVERLELKKYNKYLKRHTLHKEVK
jgi:large subunit ribosomal protein L33